MIFGEGGTMPVGLCRRRTKGVPVLSRPDCFFVVLRKLGSCLTVERNSM